MSSEPAIPTGLVVEAEALIGDEDSTFEDDQESTISLSSSIRGHVYENGRRYHAYGEREYLAPNDEAENARLDMHHHLATLLINGKLHVAPIGQHPQRILDLGCGTGIWSIDMGDAYPSAEVIGVDISPTQPSIVPPNVRFEVDDIEHIWTYRSQFDLIHARFLAAAIADWPKLVGQVYEFTKPGGWCEFKDWDLQIYSTDNTLPKDSHIQRFHDLTLDALEKLGVVHSPAPKLKGWVEAAGFQDVHEDIEPLPIGSWPKEKRLKEIGIWNRAQFEDGLEAICLRLWTSVLGWNKEEVQLFLVEMRKELKNKAIHAQWKYHIVFGQKPRHRSGTSEEDST
ncbi:hypothetical protein BP5796_12434 [Coleophoma crateriformis]|uniref:S-adenosyl-L-methionine-dependent methyltransferase n=1 Tax=Coleophoma crateriformis TaxID=565419 RepID=A0A3D8QAK4_9HELO|nr:hypothetical protein BP5796_12434 [Coleophoma crateriformis]